MCTGGSPNIPKPVEPPAPPPIPVYKEQISALKIGKKRQPKKDASTATLRRDLTRGSLGSGASYGGHLL